MSNSLISVKKAERFIDDNVIAGWKRQVVQEVIERILHKDYPCVFTRAGYEKDHLQFTFVEDPFDANELHDTFKAISDFVEIVDLAATTQAAAMKTLLLCVDCTNLPAENEQNAVWNMLNSFLRLDTSPWPSDIPIDPNDPEWAYCVRGRRAFITVLSPSHKKRLSRNIGTHMVLLFQLRDGIEHVAPYNAKGDDVREVIRQRIEAYDHVPLAPDMTTHGEGGNKDWSQYWLGDGMVPFQGKCPLHNKK